VTNSSTSFSRARPHRAEAHVAPKLGGALIALLGMVRVALAVGAYPVTPSTLVTLLWAKLRVPAAPVAWPARLELTLGLAVEGLSFGYRGRMVGGPVSFTVGPGEVLCRGNRLRRRLGRGLRRLRDARACPLRQRRRYEDRARSSSRQARCRTFAAPREGQPWKGM